MGIAWSSREYWMRQVLSVLSAEHNPRVCPQYPFAAVLVNHTAGGGDLGDLICTGRNQALETGNAILHGKAPCHPNAHPRDRIPEQNQEKSPP
jgi:tRNA(Arg) A34 adenosine deaminase TadA